MQFIAVCSQFWSRLRENLGYLGFPQSYSAVDSDIDGYRGLYSKGLQHDSNGTVNPDDMRLLLRALSSGDIGFLQQLNSSIKQVDPSVLTDIELVGPYKQIPRLNDAPSIVSDVAARELLELYWMALLRDVPFQRYEHDALVKEACRELKVNPNVLFRLHGDRSGYYVSQLLLQSYQNGGTTLFPQTWPCYTDRDFNTTPEAVIHTQNGDFKGELKLTSSRYAITLRDGATYVHKDNPVVPWQNAALVLQTLGIAPNPGLGLDHLPEHPFIDRSTCDLFGLLNQAVRCAFQAAWYVKWNQLKVRPEVAGLYVDQRKRFDDAKTEEKDKPQDSVESPKSVVPLSFPGFLLESEALNRTYERQGSWVLSTCFPEGSPAHPSFPSGHATVAGACSTVLKAFYDNFAQIQLLEPSRSGTSLQATGKQAPVWQEIDKLANNLAVFRNAAGIHYRSDAEGGIALGEEVALQLLRANITRYKDPTKWVIRRRSGKVVEISNV